MTGWLLDTNVISELRRASPSRRVAEFVATLPLEQINLSVVTYAELRYGIETLGDAARRSDLTLWLENVLRTKFAERTLELTEDILVKWRLMIAAGRQRGMTYSHPDILIAATAAHYGHTVVTRNVDEFLAAGVSVMNPWTGREFHPAEAGHR